MMFSVKNHQALTKLLIKAAGLEGKKVTSLTVHCGKGGFCTFTAEINGEDEQIERAMTNYTEVVMELETP